MAKRKDKQRSTRHYTEKKRSSNLQIYSVSSMFISYKYTNEIIRVNQRRTGHKIPKGYSEAIRQYIWLKDTKGIIRSHIMKDLHTMTNREKDKKNKQ